MKNYNNFLNEEIHEIIKSYKEIIYDIFKKNGYGEYIINLKNEDLLLINLKINFIKGDWYSVAIGNRSVIKNENLYYFEFIFKIPNDDQYRIKEEISHELNHCKEYYDNKINGIFPVDDIIGTTLNLTKNQNDTPFNIFRKAIYLSLNGELSSKISQTYIFLMKFNTMREDILLDELKKYSTWLEYELLMSDNHNKLFNYLIKNMGEYLPISLTNDLNKKIIDLIEKYNIQIYEYDFIYDNISNLDELKLYLMKWYNIIHSKMEDYRKNLLLTIEDVIKDQRPIMEGYFSTMTIEEIEEYKKYISL